MEELHSDTQTTEEAVLDNLAFDEQAADNVEKQLRLEDKSAEPDFDPGPHIGGPEAGPAQQRPAVLSQDEAAASAFAVMEMMEGTLQATIHPDFAFDNAVKEEAINKYGPVIAKHGGAFMGLMGRYQEEVAAALFTATLVRSSLSQAKQLKVKAKAEQDAQASTEQGVSDAAD